MEAGHCPEREGEHEESERLGERNGGIGGSKRTERSEPERGMARPGGELRRRDAGRKAGKEKATGEFEEDLQDGRGKVVFHPEKLEAEGEEEGIAGQAYQARNQLPVGTGEGIAAVEEETLSEVAVEERISVDLEEVFQHPKTEYETGHEGRNEAERRGKLEAQGSTRGRGRPWPRRQLTLEGGFHTIRNV